MKKTISALCVGCLLYIGQITNVTATPYRKTQAFPELSTIKTWVADKYHNQKGLMRDIKHFVDATTSQHGSLNAIFKMVPQDEDTKRDFGKTFYTLPAIELPFLQKVKEMSQNKNNGEPMITLEIAAARGYVSWKVPLAFEGHGTHYANDLSSKVIKELKTNIQETFDALEQPELITSVKTIDGSCFNILKNHPELKNKVDVIYVQNLEHFLNPQQHKELILLIEDLLAPGGYAFFSAHSTGAYSAGEPNKDTTSEYWKLFLTAEANGTMYPSFIQYDVEFAQADNTETITNPRRFNIKRPENDSIECYTKTLNTVKKYGARITTQHVVTNYYTPKIYRQAIENNTKLAVVDAYFMDGQGLRQDNKNWNDPSLVFAAVIVRKNATSPITNNVKSVINFGELDKGYELSQQMGVYHGHTTSPHTTSPISKHSIPTNENIVDNNEMIAIFMKEVLQGNTKKVKDLLKEGIEIDQVDAYGYTALMHASSHVHIEIVKILLAKGADPKKTAAYTRMNAINFANAFNHKDCLKALLIASFTKQGYDKTDIMNYIEKI